MRATWGQCSPGLGATAWAKLWGGSGAHGRLPGPPARPVAAVCCVFWCRPEPGALGSHPLSPPAQLCPGHAPPCPRLAHTGSLDCGAGAGWWFCHPLAVPEASKMSAAFPSAFSELLASRDLCCSLGALCDRGEQGPPHRKQAEIWERLEWSEKGASYTRDST